MGRDSERDIAAEHAAILEATVVRDIPTAVALLAEHIRRTTDILLSSPAAETAAEAAGETDGPAVAASG